MLPPNERDATLYYGNTFVRFKGEWVYARNFARKAGSKEFVFQFYRRDNKVYIETIDQDTLDLSLAKAGFYFYNKFAYYLFKLPVRQAQKALSMSNGFWRNPLADLVPENFRIAKSLGKELEPWISALSSDRNNSLDKARNVLSRGKVLSIPLSDHWALSLAPEEEFEYGLWYRTSLVGLINGDKVAVVTPSFAQEIKDCFKELRAI